MGPMVSRLSSIQPNPTHVQARMESRGIGMKLIRQDIGSAITFDLARLSLSGAPRLVALAHLKEWAILYLTIVRQSLARHW